MLPAMCAATLSGALALWLSVESKIASLAVLYHGSADRLRATLQQQKQSPAERRFKGADGTGRRRRR